MIPSSTSLLRSFLVGTALLPINVAASEGVKGPLLYRCLTMASSNSFNPSNNSVVII